jgi:hypothetical protein
VVELDPQAALSEPVVIAAFEGWNDAGEAASAAVSHLSRACHASPAGAIDPEDYYDFQVTRPVTEVAAGKAQHLTWPTTRLLAGRLAAAGRERSLLLVAGIEPNMRWRRFCGELAGAFTAARATLVVLLGALLADSPHTRPVPVSASACDPSLAAGLHVTLADYRGPTGIVGALQHACGEAGIPVLSLWAAVPHYVAQAPSPKATLALLRVLEDLLDVPVPLDGLPQEAEAWQRGVDELAESDSEVAEYVRALEAARDATELPEVSGDAIAAEFERYLRRRGERGH